MDQAVTEGLQKLQLTKEEEEDIPITVANRQELLEECHLNLFGRLLSERQQNQRALKNTLRSVWKMGSELRIVEVGNNILQFKFNSKYQMEWVERSGPWNFDNNLLLLSRWKKGMTTANITFTHSPFWVQVWGLPFEFLSEEVGKEIGCKLGEVIEVDKRSWQADQAKFMRIRVNFPIHKPLRRGAHITNAEGERFWIHFKYERLPTFCFICGKLGHDDKHCTQNLEEQPINQQYGDWIRAGGQGKGNVGKAKPTSSRSHESMEEEVTEQRFRMEPKNRGKNAQTVNDGNEAGTESQNLENMNAEMSGTIEPNLQDGWDNMEKVENVLAQAKETRDEQKGTKSTLVRDLLKGNEEAYPLVGLQQRASTEIFGVLSPVTPKSGATEDLKNKAQDLGSDGAKKTKASGKLKKVAREMGKRQIENKEA